MSVLPDGAFGERVARRLRTEPLAWLTTVGADGTPQPNPVWFLWDGADRVLVYNRADAARLRHVARRPSVSLHLETDATGDDVIVLLGTAREDRAAPPVTENAAYLDKYGEAIARVTRNAERFAEQYSVPLQIDIHRIRGF